MQEGADGRARARPARDRLAHGARPHRRGRLLPRPRHRHARQDLDGREALDADRGRPRSTSRSTRAAARRAPCRRSAIRSPASISTATAALVRQNVAALLEAAVADHERSTGPWEIEWIALPEIFLLASGALRQTRDLVAGLQVDAERMRDNLDLTDGNDRVGGGDDGARPASRPPARARSRLRHLPRRRDKRRSRWSICWRRSRKSPST